MVSETATKEMAMKANSAACRDCVYCASPRTRDRKRPLLSLACGKCGHAQRWHSGDFVAQKSWNKPKKAAAEAPQVIVQMVAPAVPHPQGWYADPMRRFQWRWYDGRSWTDDVANGPTPERDPQPLPR